MKKLIYFYLLVSLPCGICVLWDTHRSLFAMEEGKVEEPPSKTEIEAAQAKEKKLLQEKLFLEEESLAQEKQQAQQAQTNQLPAGNSQKTAPSKSSDTTDILAAEKTKEEEIEKTKQEIDALSKELTTEFATNEPPSKSDPKPSAMTICIGNLIMQNITKAHNIFENKSNEVSFTDLTNELDSTIGQLVKYESEKIGPSYSTMKIDDIQARRNNMLRNDPQNKDYDKIYAQLVNQEQSIRTKVKQLIQEKTGAEIGFINTIVEGCANKKFINILVKGEQASESILSGD